MINKILIFGAPLILLSLFVHAGHKHQKMPFTSLSIVYEINETDEDAEVVIKAKAFEGMKYFKVFSPTGEKIINIKSENDGDLGLAQFVLESGEPNIEDVLAGYPEGKYTFKAKTVSNVRLFGQVELSHFVTLAPIFSPCNESNIDPDNLTISWDPIPEANSYEIEVENDELEVNVTSVVGSEVNSFSFPTGFLLPGTSYEIGLTSVTKEGNKSVSECEFSTAP